MTEITDMSSEHILIKTILEENKYKIKDLLRKHEIKDLEYYEGPTLECKIFLRTYEDDGFKYGYYARNKNTCIEFYNFRHETLLEFNHPYMKYPWYFTRDIFDFLVEVLKEA